MIKRPFFGNEGNYIEDGEPIYLGGIVKGGTPRFHVVREDLLANCRDKDSAISTMLKDRTMYRQIKERNASDKSLKRDAEFLQRQDTKKRKVKEKTRIWAKANASLARYRKKYKQEPL